MKIESELRQIINDTICGKYLGKLQVIRDEDEEGTINWALLLYLDTEMSPIIMACQGTEDHFKEFVREEIKHRKLQGVKFYSVKLEYRPEEDE